MPDFSDKSLWEDGWTTTCNKWVEILKRPDEDGHGVAMIDGLLCWLQDNGRAKEHRSKHRFLVVPKTRRIQGYIAIGECYTSGLCSSVLEAADSYDDIFRSQPSAIVRIDTVEGAGLEELEANREREQ